MKKQTYIVFTHAYEEKSTDIYGKSIFVQTNKQTNKAFLIVSKVGSPVLSSSAGKVYFML